MSSKRRFKGYCTKIVNDTRTQKTNKYGLGISDLKPTLSEIGYGNAVLIKCGERKDEKGTVELAADNGEILVRIGDSDLLWFALDQLKFTSLKRRRTKFGEQQDYHDKLKAIEWRKEGVLTKKEIAVRLNRGEGWVKKWWNMHPNTLKIPENLHVYRENSWMDLKYKRGYAAGLKLHNRILQAYEWTDAIVKKKETYGVNRWRWVVVKRCPNWDFCKGGIKEIKLKSLLNRSEHKQLREKIRLRNCNWCSAPVSFNGGFTKYCNNCKTTICLSCHSQCGVISAGRQCGIYIPGILPIVDALVDQMAREFKLPYGFTTAFNWYPNGNSKVAPHRHDNWTISLSFGASRILTVDYQECLMDDGDLVIFGTQKHGVPVMPEVQEGRISLILMWEPTEYHLSGRWRM